MSEFSDEQSREIKALRDQIIGLGAKSVRKTYYPQLRQQIEELKSAKAELEEKSASLQRTLSDLEDARRRAEESELQFRTFFEEITDGIFVGCLATYRFRRVNPAYCRMMGYLEPELLRLSAHEIHPRDELSRIAELIDKLKHGEHVVVRDLRHIRKDGSEFFADVHATTLQTRDTRYFIAACTDMTERKMAELELQRLNRLYAFLSEVNQAVVHINSSQELLEVVCKAAAQFGSFKLVWIGKVDPGTRRIVPQASAGKRVDILEKTPVYADERSGTRSLPGGCVRDGVTKVVNDYALQHSDYPFIGVLLEAGIRATAAIPIRNQGAVYGVLVLCSSETNVFMDKEVALLEEVAADISFALDHLDQEERRRRDEAALKKAKEDAEAANKAKDQFIAVLSHELRTPLTPVLTAASLLQSMDDIPEGIRPDLDIIRRNAELEARLIDDLLDVTRISRGLVQLHPEEVDVHVALLKTLEICRAEIAQKAMEIVLKLDAGEHYVLADSARLQQVFWNLVKNALKFTPPEGRISIRTENVEDRIRVEVADTGIGIPEEALLRIFNAFEQAEKMLTRRFGGLGLGLSIAKAVVELHQGTIYARSDGPEKGAVFTVELHTIAPGPGHPAERVAPPVLREKQWRVLLVEDNLDTLRILSRLLERWGYEVLGADTVAGALEAASREPLDLLISDIGLPDGSGLEVMREIQRGHPHVRGVAISGFGTDEDIRQSREAGFAEHLTKPVAIEGLRAAIDRLVTACDQPRG
ncbi:MAG: ATP-binding protein [Chthoniobacteraceae bacterium]